MTQPQSEHIYGFATSITSPIGVSAVDLHQLYPGDCGRDALHPDSFGSDFNGHMPQNVPELPYGMRMDSVWKRCLGDKNRRVRARYGLRACRIGEARHPGPPLVAGKYRKAAIQPAKANRTVRVPGTATEAIGGFHMGGLWLPEPFGPP